LTSLKGSKDSIRVSSTLFQNAKNWVLENIPHSNSIIRRIAVHVKREPDSKRKLIFIYLISDCLHHSLKLRPLEGGLDEFSQAVLDHLVPLLRPAYYDQSEDMKGKIIKVIRLWEDRSIFDTKILKKIESSIKKTTL